MNLPYRFRENRFSTTSTWLALAFVCILPALSLVPMLVAPLPATNSHIAVEIAGYYQALALVEDGLASYTYLTPAESYSALHLHSLLSAPLLALGYIEAGRFITLLSSVIASALVAVIARRLLDARALLLAPVLLWANPVFIRLSSRWYPETLGIALTAGTLLALLRYLDNGQERWYLTTLVLIVLGITNHMWEASILLPLVMTLGYHQRWKRAAGIIVVTIAAIVATWWGTHQQPTGASTLTHFALYNDPAVLLDPAWWSHIPELTTHPLKYAETATLPLALLGLGWLAWWAYQTRERTPIVLGAWLASGVALPLGLPLGADNHFYYNWALLAPLAVTMAAVFLSVVDTRPSMSDRRAVHTAVVGVLVLAVMYGLVFEVGLLAGTSVPVVSNVHSSVASPAGDVDVGEAVTAGQTLRTHTIDDASEVVFVGEWGRSSGTQYQHIPAASRVLIYGDIHVTERDVADNEPGAPRFVDAGELPSDCAVTVRKRGGSVVLGTC